MDAVHLRDRPGDLAWVGPAPHEQLVRKDRALADAGALERDQALLGVARLGDRVGVGGA